MDEDKSRETTPDERKRILEKVRENRRLGRRPERRKKPADREKGPQNDQSADQPTGNGDG